MGSHYIWQDAHAQPVSHASFALQKAALDHCGEERLRVLDLGSGSGIVAIMLALQRPQWQITGIEIQSPLTELARRNCELCGVQVGWLNHDLRTFTPDAQYDLIVGNPPWQQRGRGKPSPHEARNLSRVEILCGMPEVLECVSRNLSAQGLALLLYPASRSDELRSEAQKSLLDIISLLPATGLQDHVICQIRHKGTSA